MSDLLTLLTKAVPKGGVLAGDAPELNMSRISTMIPPLDLLLGGGLPRRRSVLLFGAESSGKSFLAQKLCVACQRQGLKSVYVDVEKCFEPVWGQTLGLNITDRDTFVVAQPGTGEAAVDVVSGALEQEVDLIVLDSIAALIPTKLLESEAENVFVGLLARLVNPAIGRWSQMNVKTVLVLINQIRDVIGSPIHEERFPGGVTQKYASSLTIRVRRHGWITEGNERKGFPMFMRIEKSKVPGATPWTTCEIPFLYDGSLDVVESLINVAIAKDIIRQDGAHYYFLDQKIYGRNNVVKLFKENPDLMEIIMAQSKLSLSTEDSESKETPLPE